MSAANSFINIGAAIVTHDLPIAFGRRVKNELRWGRTVTVFIAIAAAITAQRSGTMVAFLGSLDGDCLHRPWFPRWL